MSHGAKLILLGIVIITILYVLISPLPELAATSSLNLHISTYVFLIILLLARPAGARLDFLRQLPFASEVTDVVDRTCVRLC